MCQLGWSQPTGHLPGLPQAAVRPHHLDDKRWPAHQHHHHPLQGDNLQDSSMGVAEAAFLAAAQEKRFGIVSLDSELSSALGSVN